MLAEGCFSLYTMINTMAAMTTKIATHTHLSVVILRATRAMIFLERAFVVSICSRSSSAFSICCRCPSSLTAVAEPTCCASAVAAKVRNRESLLFACVLRPDAMSNSLDSASLPPSNRSALSMREWWSCIEN
jgi:hypothetical protein